MKVEIERDALLGALEQVTGVVERRNTIPILSNLQMVVGAGKLSVTGTDLDIEATASASAAGELRTTVSSDKILAAVKSFKPGKLTITPVEGRHAVTVKQGRGVRTISTLPIDDFPKRAALGSAVSFSMPSSTLARILGACAVAQSTDETRFYLIGVFLHTTEDKLRGAATDGHRLIRVETDLPEGAEDLADIIVPKKTVALVLQMLGKAKTDVAIQSNGTAISFQIGSSVVISKLIEGTFPDYSRVIPDAAKNKINVVREALTGAVAAVASVVNAGGNTKVRAVALEFGSDVNEVRASDPDGTSANEPIDATYQGAPIQFGLNSQYLRDVAGIFAEGAALTITLQDPAAPLRIVSDKDPDIVGVLMPMRV